MTMLDLFKKYEESINKANLLDEKWDKEPENEELEKMWVEAYNEQQKCFENLAVALVANTNFILDLETAKKLIRSCGFTIKEYYEKLNNNLKAS